MTDMTMAFMELLRKHELEIDSDFLQEGVQIMIQKLIELEAEQQIGAELDLNRDDIQAMTTQFPRG